MNKRSILFIFLTLILSLSFVLPSYGSEEKSIDQMMNALKLEKMQAHVMINKLADSGRLNRDEVLAAKREIASIQEENLQEIKSGALEQLKVSDSFANQ